MEQIVRKILDKLDKNEVISPFLFIWDNIELLNEKVSEIWLSILKELKIPKEYLFKIIDDWTIIKIKDMKIFLEWSNSVSGYRIKIFLIENFSRSNLQSANSCLKIFEEPWIHNIFFLTNESESWIIDTILSRVQIIDLWLKKIEIKNNFFYNLLDEWFKEKKINNLIWYIYNNKLEKEEYIIFLNTLITYLKDNFILIEYLNDILDDLNWIHNNNWNAKNICDKWVLKISLYIN